MNTHEPTLREGEPGYITQHIRRIVAQALERERQRRGPALEEALTRKTVWPMVAVLLDHGISPDNDMAIWRALRGAGFPQELIRLRLPDIVADMKARRIP